MSPVHPEDTLRVKNFIKIAISRTISKIYTFLCFTQKFKVESNFGEKSPAEFAYTLWIKNFVKTALSCTVSKINAVLRSPPKMVEKRFLVKVASRFYIYSAGQKFCHLSCTVSEINALLRFTQKFKTAAKSGGKAIFWEKSSVDSVYTLWVKNFVGIALSHTVSEISVFAFTQKFKMAAESGGKVIL